jgi:predicted dithiol-disulfide oxidoreductase (DUF899 family)
MNSHRIVSREEWLAARKALLEQERDFTHARDRLSAARRALPWEKIEDYQFEGAAGAVRLSELFRGKSQLILQHFMFHPDWSAGCKSCSFWADQAERITVHLRARDANFVAVSRAPLAKLDAFKARMGWSFEWVSCGAEARFNHDFGAYLAPADLARDGNNMNYGLGRFSIPDVPAISVFAREGDQLYHTYSTYARGLDMVNGAYHYLDLLPKGRDEEGLPYPMDWVRLRDEYPAP